MKLNPYVWARPCIPQQQWGRGPQNLPPEHWLGPAPAIGALDAQDYSQSTASLTSKSPLATQMLVLNPGGSRSSHHPDAKSEPGLCPPGLGAVVLAQPPWIDPEAG